MTAKGDLADVPYYAKAKKPCVYHQARAIYTDWQGRALCGPCAAHYSTGAVRLRGRWVPRSEAIESITSSREWRGCDVIPNADGSITLVKGAARATLFTAKETET